MDLVMELQKIYDSKINIEVVWACDGGIDVRLGVSKVDQLRAIAVRKATE